MHITELGGDYFKFDETRQELRGERTGIRYSVGARVRVQVSRVDLDGRKIDFRWVQEDGSVLDKPVRGKDLPAAKSGRNKSRSTKQNSPTGAKIANAKTKAASKSSAPKAKKKSKNRH